VLDFNTPSGSRDSCPKYTVFGQIGRSIGTGRFERFKMNDPPKWTAKGTIIKRSLEHKNGPKDRIWSIIWNEIEKSYGRYFNSQN